MNYHKFADVVRDFLRISPAPASAAMIAMGLVSKTKGLLAAYGNSVGALVCQYGLVLGDVLTFKSIVTAVAAAGSTVADAGQLGDASIVHITSDGAAKGVKLPTTTAANVGDVVFVINNSSTAAELYAASGGTVNGLSADASVVVPASKGLLCFCTGANTWVAFDLTAKATAS